MSTAKLLFHSQTAFLRLLWTLNFFVACTISTAYAAQVSLFWQDPNNNQAEVGGYNLYYWQTDWNTPASINVGKQTSHTLTDLEAGQTYHFAVTAHDGNGGRESVYSNVVSKTFSAATPVASFTLTPSSGTVPLAVVFTDTSIGSITSWAWNFGDGSTSTLQHPSHTYTIAGAYTVTLTVTNASGADTATTTITVANSPGTPPACPCSVWNSSTIPAVAAHSDAQAVELGMKFQADVNGHITGIRFYKGAANTGTHVGRLWTSSGTLLGSVTFSNETATG
jgi:PKD repeat protein